MASFGDSDSDDEANQLLAPQEGNKKAEKKGEEETSGTGTRKFYIGDVELPGSLPKGCYL
jgi:hypothetical protein